MDFKFPPEMRAEIVDSDPERSYWLVGVSLTLPYVEPYLIRTMQEAKKRLTDPAQIDAVERFCAQEGQHFKQHVRLNDIIRSQGFDGLAAIEKTLDEDYRRFSETKSLRFNLAYAEGFEAATTAVALGYLENGTERMHPAAAAVGTWHLIEELEHRTVAFDVYHTLYGDYWYRCVIGLYAKWHLLRFIVRVVRYMMDTKPEIIAQAGGLATIRRQRNEPDRKQIRTIFLNTLRSQLPWYTPHSIAFTEEMERIARELTASAVSSR
jgi:predicted metal-dependent hydrolase